MNLSFSLRCSRLYVMLLVLGASLPAWGDAGVPADVDVRAKARSDIQAAECWTEAQRQAALQELEKLPDDEVIPFRHRTLWDIRDCEIEREIRLAEESKTLAPPAETPAPLAKSQSSPDTKKPSRQSSRKPAVSQLIRQLLKNLDKTKYLGADFDYWPEGGVRNSYFHLATYLSYKTLSESYGGPIFLSGPHSRDSLDFDSLNNFGRYDPAFVDWFGGQLTSITSDVEFVKETRPLVDKYLLSLAFLYFESYKYLEQNPRVKAELLSEYKTKIDKRSLEEGFYWWLSFLPSKNSDADIVWIMKQLDEYDSNRASSAIYFWVRRSIDGTDRQFFELVSKFLLAYDRTSVSNYQKLTQYARNPTEAPAPKPAP